MTAETCKGKGDGKGKGKGDCSGDCTDKADSSAALRNDNKLPNDNKRSARKRDDDPLVE
jgi:hypothetical protein